MPFNPWAGYRMSGTWQDHMSYSLGGEDYPLGYGTGLKAPASGTLRTSGGTGEKAAGWIGSAGRRSILDLDTPLGAMASIVFQHQSAFGTHGKHYAEGEILGRSGASANGKDYGGETHLHVHGLTADGRRVPFTQYIGGSSPAGGGSGLTVETQKLLQQYITNAKLYSGPIDGALGTNGWKGIQQWLANVGLYGGPIDGDPGTNTYIGLQRVAQQAGYTGPLDGDIGVNSDAALNVWLKRQLTPAVPQPTAGWVAWQTFLRGYGYEGPIDGNPGLNTWIALQKFLAEKFGYTGPIDGEPGPMTYEAWNRSAAAGYPNLPKPEEPKPEEPKVFPAGETTLTGVDLGTSQKDFDFEKFAAAGGDFAIIKLGGGNASDSPYQSPHADDQMSRARACQAKYPDFIVGHYWMNGNKNGLTPTTSAQYFARYIPLMEGDLIGLDIEAIDGVPAYTPAEALEFTREFQKFHAGAVFEIYLNRALINTYDWQPLIDDGHVLWVATLDGTRVPAIGEWEEPSIVQFKIAHSAGGAFDTDLNIAKDLAPARFKRAVPEPEPEPEPDPTTTLLLSEYFVKSVALGKEYADKLGVAVPK
jgi:hypothetical protein